MASLPISPETGPQAVLELIYRLKVRDAMSSPVITASPKDGMRDVQYLMRDNGITGVPIVEGGRLVGLVSMGLVIEALDSGRIEQQAGELMTRTVISLEDDMPLAFATTYFNRYKFGRFPVLDRDGSLVGILCASDIIRALLVAMNKEVERLEERLSAASTPVSGSPADGLVRLSFQVTRFDFENAARRAPSSRSRSRGSGSTRR
jgi:CBS domain-containing protein